LKSILALDLGTKTGWATRNATGTKDFKNGRFDGGGMRFLKFRRWLDEIIALEGINEIVFEEVRRHIGTDASHVYGGFLATLTAYCEEKNVRYSGIPVGTIKKHATGKGNSGKPAMMDAYRKKWCVLPIDDNECDARWLFDLVSIGK